MSDNCDHNFGTFDDFGVKNDQKVSHNMILMSKYKGQHGGKKGKKIRARSSPPLFFKRCSLTLFKKKIKLKGIKSVELHTLLIVFAFLLRKSQCWPHGAS